MQQSNDTTCGNFLFKIENREFKCPVTLTMDAIGGKWKILLLWKLFSQGTTRYSEFKKYLGKITDKMLTQSLRELESDGLVTRHVYNTVPPHVEYTVSEHGKNLEEIVRAMHHFGSLYQVK